MQTAAALGDAPAHWGLARESPRRNPGAAAGRPIPRWVLSRS